MLLLSKGFSYIQRAPQKLNPVVYEITTHEYFMDFFWIKSDSFKTVNLHFGLRRVIHTVRLQVKEFLTICLSSSFKPPAINSSG